MSFITRKKKIQFNYLELTPERIYSHELREKDGYVDVLVPKFTDIFFGKLIQPRLKHKYIKANLDKFGSSVWLHIDGESNVAAIAGMLTQEFGDEIQPVEQRLTTFFSQLYQAGFITFKELERN